MTEQLLCKDCTHFQFSSLDKLRGLSNEYGKCKLTRKTVVEYNYINGKHTTTIAVSYAKLCRSHGECGTQGKFWVSEKKKHLFTLLKHI